MATLLAMTTAQPNGLRFCGVARRALPRFIIINGVVKMDNTLTSTIKVMAISRSVMAVKAGFQVFKCHKLNPKPHQNPVFYIGFEVEAGAQLVSVGIVLLENRISRDITLLQSHHRMYQELLSNLVYGIQAAFSVDCSSSCLPSLKMTLLTTKVNKLNP